ncbi:hypothetical protein ACK323_06725 [Aeromonas enteropelogenes]|uniref:hypothetical protein n=1 Tax=Aeromonas enteropelogenes TaxID=29489 RepID=UPI00398A4BFF
MNKFRYKEPESLILYVYGNDHTPLTNILKEVQIEANAPVSLFSNGPQFLIEIFDWISKNPVQVGEICGVLVAFINRHPKASLTYSIDGKTVKVNNISARSAVEFAKELRQADIRTIYINMDDKNENTMDEKND